MREFLRPRPAVTIAAIAALGALVPALTTDPYHLEVGKTILEAFVLTMSLRLVMAIGHLNMAHVSFMGIGAYVSAALVMHAGLSVWLALPAAGLAAGAVAVALGAVTLRLSGAYFFLVTFALLEVVRLFFHTFFPDIFGGASGLIGVPRPAPLVVGSVTILFSSHVVQYLLALALWLAAAVVLVRLDCSRFGLVARAIRQRELLAATVGVNILSYKIQSLVVASVIAGIAGSFFAHSRMVVHPSDFGVGPMLLLVAFVVVGGAASVWGPLVGTTFLMLASEALRPMRQYETLMYGTILILAVRFAPDGLMGIITTAAHRITRR